MSNADVETVYRGIKRSPPSMYALTRQPRSTLQERVAESIRNNPALAGTIPDIDDALRANRRRGSEPELGHIENIQKYREAAEAHGSGGGGGDDDSVATNTPPGTPGTPITPGGGPVTEGSGRFKFGSFKEEGPGSPSQYEGRSLNVEEDGEGGRTGRALSIATDGLSSTPTANLESPLPGRRNSFKVSVGAADRGGRERQRPACAAHAASFSSPFVIPHTSPAPSTDPTGWIVQS